jgi:hypothetical protein
MPHPHPLTHPHIQANSDLEDIFGPATVVAGAEGFGGGNGMAAAAQVLSAAPVDDSKMMKNGALAANLQMTAPGASAEQLQQWFLRLAVNKEGDETRPDQTRPDEIRVWVSVSCLSMNKARGRTFQGLVQCGEKQVSRSKLIQCWFSVGVKQVSWQCGGCEVSWHSGGCAVKRRICKKTFVCMSLCGRSGHSWPIHVDCECVCLHALHG